MLLAIAIIFAATPASNAADLSRCERVRAEAAEVEKNTPKACDESREAHQTYVKNIPEVLQICRRLEAEVALGAPKLQLGTEDEMKTEAMAIKQKHIVSQTEITDKVNRELLGTPLDANDTTRIPPQVSSECGSEVEFYVRFRRNALRGLNEYFVKLAGFDESLYLQAQERALPDPIPVKTKNIR